MTDSEIAVDVESACRRLVTSFAHHLDHRRFHEVAALFAEDGVWNRRGIDMHGPAQILAFLEQRAATVVERHVMTATLVEQQSDKTCAATSYVTIFRTDHAGEDVPAIRGPAAFGEFYDTFRLTADGWRFTYRTSKAVFTFGEST